MLVIGSTNSDRVHMAISVIKAEIPKSAFVLDRTGKVKTMIEWQSVSVNTGLEGRLFEHPPSVSLFCSLPHLSHQGKSAS